MISVRFDIVRKSEEVIDEMLAVLEDEFRRRAGMD
jgi:hypothetical protein